MHIEIGIIDSARIVGANVAAAGLVASQLPSFLKKPLDLVKMVFAAIIFTILMQSWHLPVGPSELHLIGATTIYLLFGLAPTVVGFALGLLLQATFFEPIDFYHLGVNTLTLSLPIIAVHASFGKHLFAVDQQQRFSLAQVFKIDGAYYAGVAAMVGFWLTLSYGVAGVSEWAAWAVAYLPVFAFEALLTFTAITLIKHWRNRKWVQNFTQVDKLRFA